MTLSLTILYLYAECRYAESRSLFVGMVNVLMVRVVMLSVIMLNVIMLSALKGPSKDNHTLSLCCNAKFKEKKVYNIDTWAKCYKTFYGSNLQMYLII